jgi:hypothetical protein
MELMAMIPQRNCLWDDETIESYSMGKLLESQAAEFEEHWLVCEVCQERLARMDTAISGIRQAAARHRLESFTRKPGIRWFPPLLPALAGLAVLLVLGVIGWRWIQPGAATPAFAIKLEAMRGTASSGGPGGKAPAGRRLAVEADLSDLSAAASYRLELVDRDGHTVWKGAAPKATLPALRQGTYFMRVYSDRGELLREYGLEVEAPSTPR